MKKIFFHIGHGKTGSSYLQSCFALSQDALRKKGIYYPLAGKEKQKALAGHVSMGNLPPPKGHQHHPDGVFSSVFSQALSEIDDDMSLFFSNEALFNSLSNFHFLDQLNEISSEFEPHFLMLTRDPLEHMLSAFQQNLKGNKVSTPEEMMSKYNVPKQVGRVINAIHERSYGITVIKYENHKNDLLDRAAFWLGVPLDIFSRPKAVSVNRSLTRTEMELQRAFNTHVGRKSRLFIADALSNEVPHIRPEKPYVESDALKQFLDRMGILITETNKLLPEGEHFSVPGLNEALAGLPTEEEKHRFELNSEQIEALAKNISKFIR